MLEQNFVDLARIDVVAADDNHLLLAIDKKQVTVRVVVPDIAGIEPAVADLLPVFFGTVAVAFGELRPAQANFAALPDRHDMFAGLEIDDLNLGVGMSKTDRADLA